MSDRTTTLEELKAKILAFARERDWEQFHSPKNLSMAISAESAELMEHFLWASPQNSKKLLEDDELRRKVEEELADVIIYALEFANIAEIDVSSAISTKMRINAKKYPVEKAYGKSSKYTEL